MTDEGSVTIWLQELKAGDSDAAQQLWDRYFERLVRVARKKLGSSPRRWEDEEDVVVGALDSFFRGARAGRFPKLRDRNNLWPLLLKITERKAINQRLRQLTQKRGGGKVRGESVFVRPGNRSTRAGISQFEAPAPTPELITELSEECQFLLGKLDDEQQRTIALLKLQEFTNAEIADRLDVVERTVERKLRIIRKRWEGELDAGLE